MPDRALAAVVVLTRSCHVLALTRGATIYDLHLPGGKAEPGDPSPAHTAARELAEEAGLYIPAEDMRPLCRYTAPSGRAVQAFTADHDPRWPAEFRPTAAGWPGWVPRNALLQPWCTFSEGARACFNCSRVWQDGCQRIAEGS